MTEKKITTEYVEKMLREGREVIFQEERSLHNFKEKFKELQAKPTTSPSYRRVLLKIDGVEVTHEQ